MSTRLDDLLKLFFAKTASAREREELASIIDSTEDNILAQKLETIWLQHPQEDSLELFEGQTSEVLRPVFGKDPVKQESIPEPEVLPHGTITIKWWRYAAAAILIIATATYLSKTHQQGGLAPATSTLITENNDVLPGSDKAILTLSTGKQVILDSGAQKIINEGEVQIRNNRGELQYTPSKSAVFNTMTTPKGGQYKLTLADGTKVWLNANSSITFPTAFTQNTREVSITGEAYFEVTDNKNKPFIVRTLNEKVTVLGTKFNVNTYEDEPAVKTSLIQGAVRIQSVILKPGQAFINGGIVNTNLEQDVAWTNGLFYFDHTPIPAVLRQLARWYNLEIVYEGEVPDIECTGELLRKLNLGQILIVLRQLGVHCHIENNNRLIIDKN